MTKQTDLREASTSTSTSTSNEQPFSQNESTRLAVSVQAVMHSSDVLPLAPLSLLLPNCQQLIDRLIARVARSVAHDHLLPAVSCPLYEHGHRPIMHLRRRCGRTTHDCRVHKLLSASGDKVPPRFLLSKIKIYRRSWINRISKIYQKYRTKLKKIKLF